MKKTPEQILIDTELSLSDNNIPNYIVIENLKIAIKSYPKNKKLKAKLQSIENNPTLTKSSPKTLYLILSILISLLGLSLLVLWKFAHANQLGLFFGIAFIFVSIVIFKQFRKEK